MKEFNIEMIDSILEYLDYLQAENTHDPSVGIYYDHKLEDLINDLKRLKVKQIQVKVGIEKQPKRKDAPLSTGQPDIDWANDHEYRTTPINPSPQVPELRGIDEYEHDFLAPRREQVAENIRANREAEDLTLDALFSSKDDEPESEPDVPVKVIKWDEFNGDLLNNYAGPLNTKDNVHPSRKITLFENKKEIVRATAQKDVSGWTAMVAQSNVLGFNVVEYYIASVEDEKWLEDNDMHNKEIEGEIKFYVCGQMYYFELNRNESEPNLYTHSVVKEIIRNTRKGTIREDLRETLKKEINSETVQQAAIEWFKENRKHPSWHEERYYDLWIAGAYWRKGWSNEQVAEFIVDASDNQAKYEDVIKDVISRNYK